MSWGEVVGVITRAGMLKNQSAGVLRLSLDLSFELETLQPTTPGRGYSEFTRDPPKTDRDLRPTALRTTKQGDATIATYAIWSRL
jgi:hypothetical protein